MADDGADTFPKLLIRNALRFPDRPAMRHKDFGIWQTWTWAQLLAEVRVYAAGLSRLGLMRGDRIAIAGANRPRLYWSITAAQMLGAIPVPVYADAVADELASVLAHADVRFAAVENQEQVDKLLSVSERLPDITNILYDEPRGLRDYDHARLHPIARVIDDGRATLAADAALGPWLDHEIAAGTGADVSIILYTSGTTGVSKGVMLSAAGCIAAASDTVAFDRLDENDTAFAYLPLAWVGDHYLNYAQGLVAGFCLACPESDETAFADIREIGPTFFFAPPRVFEQMLTRVTIRMEDAGRLKQALFRHLIGVARRYGEKLLDGREVPMSARLLYAIGKIVIYAPLMNVLGLSRVRVAYTAGEAIGPDLFSFYRSLGLNLKQLYGQTEAFLYVTAQPDGQIFSDTVGPAVPNVALRIAESGEVQFKSPGMFVGYFRDEARTAEALTPDGFVKTGDAGFVDPATGHLKIVDRAKDVGRLADGTLFAPKYIENKLKFFPHIREAVAFGNDRAFAVAMLNIDVAAIGDWAERNAIAYGSYQELAGHPRVYDMLAQHVAEVNRSLAAETVLAGAQIRRFLVLPKELDPDDGELTRTQKVRRSFVAERYAPLVAALYDGSAEATIATEVTFEDGRRGTVTARVKIRDMPAQPETAAHGKAA
ncbi:MAG TPA: AMP-binding protein [Xanthobacteraceae bacterium]|nr:AMP-binding protein [Xanthobacteraceae bacterium]